jgi:hypothetical protein
MLSRSNASGSLDLPSIPSTSMNSSPWTTAPVVVAALVVLGAFGLRIWRLGVPSFWWDDAYSTMVASRGLSEIVSTLAREDFHPPLHYFLLHYWMRLAGLSEFALRFPSVAAGVLTVAAANATARRLFTSNAAPIAATVFAISPFLWYYSQEARMFSLAVLFATLAVYFCARAAQTGHWVDWGAYGLFVALGLWDFYYSVFLPIACGMWILLAYRDARQVWRWLIASAAAGVCYLPWVPIFLARTSVWSNALFAADNPAKIVRWTWVAFLLGLPTLELYNALVPASILLLGAVITLAGIAWSIRIIRKRPGALLATLAFLLPLLAMAAISAVKPVFHPRYAIPALPGLLLLLSGVIAAAWSRGRDRLPWARLLGAGTGAVVIVGSVYGLIRLNVDPNYTRDDYRSAIGYIHREELPTDTIIHNAIPPFWYYDHGPASAAYFPSRPYSEGNVVDELNDVTAGHARLWYLDNITIPNDPNGYLDSQLRLHARLLEQHSFSALRVQLWEVPAGRPFYLASFRPVALNFANQFVVDGYAVAGDLVGGGLADVELNLTAHGVPSADDGFWVALADQNGLHWGRADVQPHDGANRLSSKWSANTPVVVRFDLPIAIGTPPGQYRLVAGAYRLADLAGLDVLDSGGHPIGQEGELGTIDITRLGPQTSDESLGRQSAVDLGSGLVLTNHRIDATDLSPGDNVPVTLVWRASTQLTAMSATVLVRAANGQVVGTVVGPIGGSYPADRWPLNQVVREQRIVALAASSAAGDATVSVQVPGGPEIPLGTVTVRDVKRDFAVPPLDHPLAAHFGDSVSLVGYDLSAPTATVGSPLTVSLGWRADRAIPLSYHIFLQLLDPSDKIWAQWDGVPRNWSYPMTAWLPGEYVLDRYALQGNAPAPGGDLTLVVGLYDAVSGQRLNVISGDGAAPADHLVLQQIRVLPK